ncbi:hypothetical protein HPB47_000145 [Ixodes persulcatus]|uniref:Uncharacterized protein n=1 Tax=Ixodes persulcatus TaxID=34615 RepID=A0AC60PSK4_IXOPE|nr:hypothetical protein HPB47_000145 [Ixodes persulcatus]
MYPSTEREKREIVYMAVDMIRYCLGLVDDTPFWDYEPDSAGPGSYLNNPVIASYPDDLNFGATVLDELRGTELCLAGEGRTDTPGHFADFGTYTLLETTANHILRKELAKVEELMLRPDSRGSPEEDLSLSDATARVLRRIKWDKLIFNEKRAIPGLCQNKLLKMAADLGAPEPSKGTSK